MRDKKLKLEELQVSHILFSRPCLSRLTKVSSFRRIKKRRGGRVTLVSKKASFFF
jgi:hypothetical protein